MSCVYIYYHPITNIAFYVGEGQVYRASSHWSKIQHGKTTHNRAFTAELRALFKQNLEPIIEIRNGLTKNEALSEEAKLIAQFGRLGKEPYGTLCNRCISGSDNTGAGHYSRARPAEVKAKIAAAHLGKPKPKHTPEHNALISASMKGRTLSEAHRENLSKALKGISRPQKPRSTFIIKDPLGNEYVVHGKLDEFCLKHGLNRKSLYNSYVRKLPLSVGKNAGWQLLNIIASFGLTTS